MAKKMLINATHPEEHRVAIIEDGNLTELDIEIAGKEQTKGNIYKAVVARVESGLQAAFVDFGSERLGFLQIGEIHPTFFRDAESRTEAGKRPRITDLLRRGQEILVQVVKEERGTKGAALTTYLSLPGRYMVLMPETDTKGISRKIEKEGDRKKLKEIMESLELPDHMGYIVRTAGSVQKKTDLKRDVDYLLRLYEKIRQQGQASKAPALIYKESNLVIRSIRDYFSDEMDEVLVDDARVAAEAREFFQEVMPEYAQLVKLHQERRPIFSRYQIEEQIDTITKNKVMLPSGGSIVIDSTEALVAIDVNSGKMASEQGVEATAFKTNLEAAVEAARQLRLRDLGGLVVIDFIDMRDRKHTREVEKALKDALKYDKARVTIGRISQFGLLEMSRQRIKSALAAAAYLPCPHCHGSGRIKTSESQALALLRRIHAGLAKGNIGRIEAQLPLDVAAYLLNNKREELLAIERKNDVALYIHACPDFIAGQAEVDFQRREKEKVEETQYVEANRVLLEGAEAADMEEPAEATEATAAAEPSSADKPAKKKRRSRRRKKPAAVEEPALAVELAENIESEGTAETTGTMVTAETLETAETVEVETAETVEVEAGETVQTADPVKEPAVTAATAEPMDAVPTETAATSKPEAQDTKTPSRPRRRRKPATKREQPAASGGENPPPTGNETATATGEPPAAGPDEAAAPKPAARSSRPRPRRTTKEKKPDPGSAAVEPAKMAATQGESAIAESPAPAAEAKKPARRGRPRKSAAPKDPQKSGQESPPESGGEGSGDTDSQS